MLPTISVVIPCFNGASLVGTAIDSVLAQHPDCDVIVVDDGSTDNSLSVLKSYGDRIRWETGPHRGACYARNRGSLPFKGDYVFFLDSDDWYEGTIL